ncbi:Aste57867_10953 [Aphanomyces stellatus]|uniref:Aste57867_10953 protein n=1 Tax=Aphanomyces stellatus TaxID=120398 RepID=A0A485KSD9_9STRA|nr:hypothetical protein As57867_010913 [Aphanomyces stellatus]VFT87821.1 Aste57867_10953 [Aphanomyces stellatus]
MAPVTTPLLKSSRRWASHRQDPWCQVPSLLCLVVGVIGCILFAVGLPQPPNFATMVETVAAPGPLPVFCDTGFQSSGYIRLPHKVNDHYFYWFFESRNDPTTDSVVLWLEGGPGTSSMWSLLDCNGPCTIDANLTTSTNPYSWTNNASVIWLDQPTGVGFSYGVAGDEDATSDDVGRNIFAFLQGWFKKHPAFQSQPFFIAGKSYGGHYVPAAAAYIVDHQLNDNDDDASVVHINLQGIAIGNGLTDTVTQYPMLVEMAADPNAYNITLVTPNELKQMREDANVVAELVKRCQQPNETQACLDTDELWDTTLLEPMTTNPTRNQYDFRQLCDPDCDDFGGAKTEAFLNQPWVRHRLGARKTFSWSNDTLLDAFDVDEEINAVQYVADVLARGVRVLVFAGDADLICDWKGNDAWTKKLQWHGHHEFNAAPVVPLIVDGVWAGDVHATRLLSFVRVFNAGHMVAKDQPAVALALINRFLHHESLDR